MISILSISYNGTNADQIEALVSGSFECEQKIVNTCHVNAITNFAFWVGRKNQLNEFWHGDGFKNGTEVKGCSCSIDGEYSCSK